jgi:hypothetical protein
MNNLYSAVTNSLGFTRGISLETERFPYSLNQILIKPNDILTENNFNFALSCLYENFISIASDSYVYSPNVPITNPRFNENNNVVGTLCGTFVPLTAPLSATDQCQYYVNGIPHSTSAFLSVYNTHDIVINDNYLTIAVGILSADNTLSPILSANVYNNYLGLYNYSLSVIGGASVPLPYNYSFPDQGINASSYVQPNFGILTPYLNNNLKLKFTSITKLKFFNDRLYLLDNVSRKFLIYNVSNVISNRIPQGINAAQFDIPFETLGFATTNENAERKISTFCINKKFIAFYNYATDGISIFSSNLTHLYDYSQTEVTVNGSRNTLEFADLEFDTNGNLYLLTKTGKIFVYKVTISNLTLIKQYEVSARNSILFSSSSAAPISSTTEIFNKIIFSNSDKNVYFLATNYNIYKRFVEKDFNIGQINLNVANSTYYSTLSNIADPFNTLSTAYGNVVTSLDFYKYTINSISSLSYNGYEIFSFCFADNCTYSNQTPSTIIGNVGGTVTFNTAINTYGLNPVSASGISVIVDKPNFINLNNQELTEIKVYTFDEIGVKSEEFVTDFTVNKSLRKLLYNIFNFQTYLTFKPVVDIDINNNPLFNKLEYIVSYDKDYDFSNFDNFIGINEITSTLFLNRCFTKIFNLLTTIQKNINPELLNIYPRYYDSVLLTQTSQKFVSLYEDSKQFITGSFIAAPNPLNPNLCELVPSPTPTPTPRVSSTPSVSNTSSNSTTVTPTPTPKPSPTPLPTPTPSGGTIVARAIKHVAVVSLDNSKETPAPVPPFSVAAKTLSAICEGSGYNTLVTEVEVSFNQVAFNIALSQVNGDYSLLKGRTFGNYTLKDYIPAERTQFIKGGI